MPEKKTRREKLTFSLFGRWRHGRRCHFQHPCHRGFYWCLGGGQREEMGKRWQCCCATSRATTNGAGVIDYGPSGRLKFVHSPSSKELSTSIIFSTEDSFLVTTGLLTRWRRTAQKKELQQQRRSWQKSDHKIEGAGLNVRMMDFGLSYGKN